MTTDIHIDTERLTRLRKYLHRHPEVSGKEHETAKTILSFLRKHTPDQVVTHLGGTGIAAIYKGTERGKTVLIRCELDALPIPEVNTFLHRSGTPGISHKCGHDGHMAIVAGLAVLLHRYRPEKGRVILLFQPSEEDGNGAKCVLADNRFGDMDPDYVFALHNLPSFPEGQIVIKEGTFTPAVHSIIIMLKGKTAHAGEPEKGINPASAIADIIRQFQALVQPDIASDDFCQVAPIYLRMGEKAYGISAGEGEVHFTIRCKDNNRMKTTAGTAEKIARETAQRYGLKPYISWTQGFPANENHPKAIQYIREVAGQQGFDLYEKDTPFGWGEDFGLFTQKYPGALFGLGAGENTPALHNPDYDFPDGIISTGVQMFYHIIQKIISDR
ncbi:amidohydrolase [Sinomicrobium pectinilyticum]|uniref:Amidohydrolase n=1 Tax=Sinomicrobium pectinilyticum TaxID=1084421 RepID=A0A3N0ES22_SINP1|nr:amidohydrolase [Sinomicrobium pectinilyticum]RNL90735.1 amidohydrolase [Sinomicrobium pectinilyticum]